MWTLKTLFASYVVHGLKQEKASRVMLVLICAILGLSTRNPRAPPLTYSTGSSWLMILSTEQILFSLMVLRIWGPRRSAWLPSYPPLPLRPLRGLFPPALSYIKQQLLWGQPLAPKLPHLLPTPYWAHPQRSWNPLLCRSFVSVVGKWCPFL